MKKKDIKRLGEVQGLIGMANGWHHNDRSQDAHERCSKALERAFDIMVEVLSQYPVPSTQKEQSCD